MISMPLPTMEKYTYGSVSHYDNRIFIQEYADPDDGNDVTSRVEVQVDSNGVYIECTDAALPGIKEFVSIPTTDLGVEVAKYILQRAGEEAPTPIVALGDTKKAILERLDFLDMYAPINPMFKGTIAEIRNLIG